MPKEKLGNVSSKEDLQVSATAESFYSTSVFTKCLVHCGIHCGSLGGLLSPAIWFGTYYHHGACG